MGEAHGRFFEPTLNQSIKLRQADPRVTSDAGAILLREIDHRLGLTADLGAALLDPRDPDAIRYTQTELLRQHLYALALGYAHQDDHDILAHDPAAPPGAAGGPGHERPPPPAGRRGRPEGPPRHARRRSVRHRGPRQPARGGLAWPLPRQDLLPAAGQFLCRGQLRFPPPWRGVRPRDPSRRRLRRGGRWRGPRGGPGLRTPFAAAGRGWSPGAWPSCVSGGTDR